MSAALGMKFAVSSIIGILTVTGPSTGEIEAAFSKEFETLEECLEEATKLQSGLQVKLKDKTVFARCEVQKAGIEI